MKRDSSKSDDRSRSGSLESDGKPSRSAGRGRSGPAAQLHSTVGNRALQRLHESGAIQAKLEVSQPGDEHEREADRVAEEVVRSSPEEAAVESEEDEESEDGEEIKRKADAGGSAVEGEAKRRIESVKGGGRPLSPSTRSYFEPRFGRDFGDVRVHTDAKADEAARSIDAEAFTHGTDVVFRSNRYDPDSHRGKKLVAHELTHVVQQGEGDGGEIRRQVDTAGERATPASGSRTAAPGTTTADRENRETADEEGTLTGVQSLAGGGVRFAEDPDLDELLERESALLDECMNNLGALGRFPDRSGQGLIGELDRAIVGSMGVRPLTGEGVRQIYDMIEDRASRAAALWKEATRYRNTFQAKAEAAGHSPGTSGADAASYQYQATWLDADTKRTKVKEGTGKLIDQFLNAVEPTAVWGAPLTGAAGQIDPSRNLTSASPEILDRYVKTKRPETYQLMDAVGAVIRAREKEVLRSDQSVMSLPASPRSFTSESVEKAASEYEIINQFGSNRFLYLRELLLADYSYHSPELVTSGAVSKLQEELGWSVAGEGRSKVEKERAKTEEETTSKEEQQSILESLGTVPSLASDAFVNVAGEILETLVPVEGEKVEAEFQANVPLGTYGPADVNCVVGLKASVERSKDGLKTQFEVSLGASAQIDALIADITAAVQAVGRMVAQGDSGVECIELFVLGFAERLRNALPQAVIDRLVNPLLGDGEDVKEDMDEKDFVSSSLGLRARATFSQDEEISEAAGYDAKGAAQGTVRTGQIIRGTPSGGVETVGFNESSIKGTVAVGQNKEGISVGGGLEFQYINKEIGNTWESTVKGAVEVNLSGLGEGKLAQLGQAGASMLESLLQSDRITTLRSAMVEGVTWIPAAKHKALQAAEGAALQFAPEGASLGEPGKNVAGKVEVEVKWGPDGIEEAKISVFMIESVEVGEKDTGRYYGKIAKESRVAGWTADVSGEVVEPDMTAKGEGRALGGMTSASDSDVPEGGSGSAPESGGTGGGGAGGGLGGGGVGGGGGGGSLPSSSE